MKSINIPRGSNLTVLAKRHGVSVSDILQANPQIEDPNEIRAGEELNIPEQHEVDDSRDIPYGIETEGETTREKARSVREQLELLQEARDAGMNIDKDTSVSDAQSFLEQHRREEEFPHTTERVPRSSVEIGGIEYNIADEVINDPFFQAADEETQSMIAYTYKSLVDDGHDIETVVNAFEVAAQQTDIYTRQKIRVFEDELLRSFTELGEDYEAQERLLKTRKKQIEEDLETGLEDLSLDQQRELKQIADQYDQDLEETRNQMAEAGLGRSSIRSRAEDMLEESREDMIESTKTQYERAERDMRRQATRQIETQQHQLSDLQRRTRRSTADAMRQGEQFFGTEGMRERLPHMDVDLTMGDWMPEDWMVGDIRPGIDEKQVSDTLERQRLLLGS